MWSFRTNGNFIDFVHTDETSLAVENTIVSLHNTSKCVDWSLPEDTTRISFTIDEAKYSNILITDIDFDGTPMNSQDDFETGIEAMFPGLASSPGGSSYLSATVEVGNDELLDAHETYIELLPAPGVGKVINVIQAIIINKITQAYSDVDVSQKLGIVYGDWEYDATLELLSTSFFNDTYQWIAQLPTFTSPSGNDVQLSTGTDFTENQPIKLAIDNNAGNMTGGDAANKLSITLIYSIVDLP